MQKQQLNQQREHSAMMKGSFDTFNNSLAVLIARTGSAAADQSQTAAASMSASAAPSASAPLPAAVFDAKTLAATIKGLNQQQMQALEMEMKRESS